MVQAQNLTVTLVYTYTADGLRIAQNIDGAKRTFTWDWATPVPELLSDGESLYLIGYDTLGWQSGDDWTFVLPDALGSVRQETDVAGAVTAVREWSPYGVPLSARGEVGGAQAGLGYTGEWCDPYRKLLYLRARWYDGDTGRFTSPDSIVPDYQNPPSIHRYAYVENNVINLTDPSGLTPTPNTPPNHYNLTYWLHDELRTNSTSHYVRRIFQLWVSPDADDKLRALGAFYLLVRDEAKWDFKHKIKRVLGSESIALSHWEEHWHEYSVPGNVHYGFVGRAAGFDGSLLHAGAGFAEIKDPAHKTRGEACCPQICRQYQSYDLTNPMVDAYCVPLGCYYINPDWAGSLFDDPIDWQSVEVGIQMYNTYGRQITLDQFKSFLAFPGNELDPASPPSTYTAFNWDWPYRVGYFNGPGDEKNERLIRLLLSQWWW